MADMMPPSQAPHYTDSAITLHHGDCLEVLRSLPDASVDAVVTDPPYGLEFMGKEWDAPWKASGVGRGARVAAERSAELTERGKGHSTSAGPYLASGVDSVRVAGKPFQEWCEAWARECLRVLKPGGHMLAFGGTRTWHRLACAVEDAGFEVRDSIAWLYGSGFPKSLDVSKAIDRMAPRAGMFADFAAHYGERRRAAGLNHREVCEAGRFYGEHNKGGASVNWEKGYGVPTLAQWATLAPLLDLSDEWLPLIERVEAEREVTGQRSGSRLAVAPGQGMERGALNLDITAPATDAARAWQGWGTALKPSHEPCVLAQKPYAVRDILEGIGSQLARLESECKRPAKDAAWSSAPTPHGSSAARTGSAPASAATPHEDEPERIIRTGAAAGSSAQTDMSASESTVGTCWNTVTSWKGRWAELYDLTSTFTTSTTTGLTTDLRTLWSSISSLTVTSTPDSPTPRLTSTSTASAVDNLFAATVLNLRATLALSAPESATENTRTSRRDAGGNFDQIVVARKPIQGTVAANVLAHGTGALNIAGCRIGDGEDRVNGGPTGKRVDATEGYMGSWSAAKDGRERPTGGRWPANVVLDESQAAALDEQSGDTTRYFQAPRQGDGKSVNGSVFGEHAGDGIGYNDSGGASRYFYVAKADASERVRVNGTAHSTVKPLALMRWLVRLVTPPGGTVLEPFAGSGTTVEACILEGFRCVAIEREADYLPLIVQRVNRRRDPVEAVKAAGEDAGLFGLLDGEAS